MIETLDDWNARLSGCGCCQMPVCPTPVVLCEAKYGRVDREDTWDGITYDASGDLYDGDPIEYQAFHPAWTDVGSLEEVPTIYRKRTHTYEDEFQGVEIGDPIMENYVECTSATVKTFVTHIYDGAGHVLITRNTHTLSEPLTKAELEALTLLKMEADAWTNTSGSGPYVCRANKAITWATFPEDWEACEFFLRSVDTFGAISGLRKIRFRFRIPHTHTGSKFYITYDIAEFPENAEVDPSFVSQDNVIEWTGLGTGGQNDPSWLAGDWIEIDPPEVSGERRIVNIRYTCYAGTRFGSKPQVMGEAFEIPPP